MPIVCGLQGARTGMSASTLDAHAQRAQNKSGLMTEAGQD